MNRYRVSGQARTDLDDIWLYIARDNIDAADRLIRVIVLHFVKLANLPDLGRLRQELAPNLRSHPVGRYVIFYRLTGEGIDIIRVLHGARDLPPLFQ